MLTKTTALAAAIAFTASTAFAGGLSPEIVETPVMEEPAVVPAGSSIDPTYIVVGVIAALLIAAAVSDGGNGNNGNNGIVGDGGSGGGGGGSACGT